MQQQELQGRPAPAGVRAEFGTSPRECPCCQSSRSDGYWALIAPFIVDYVRPAHSAVVQLLECRKCGHRYFSYRFTEPELERLYGSYRQHDYFTARNRVEPWYRHGANTANLEPGLIQARKEALHAFLRPHLPADGHRLVVADVGGDAGQFIPLDIASAAYLIEASDQKPVPGVERLPSLDAAPEDIQLLICAHVLEHLPYPTRFLGDLLSSPRLRPGSLIYLEVPLERYSISRLLGSRLNLFYLRSLLRVRPLLILVDFCSVLARSYLGFVFPPLILKMHEHINFFTARSLQECLAPFDLEIISVAQECGSSLSTLQGVIRLLARRR